MFVILDGEVRIFLAAIRGKEHIPKSGPAESYLFGVGIFVYGRESEEQPYQIFIRNMDPLAYPVPWRFGPTFR